MVCTCKLAPYATCWACYHRRCDERRAKQAAEVACLEAELAQLEADGDEYHAEGVKDDLVAAQSLARLIHK
jgi:hypothetical protein